jgi:[amino group carrier protein]-lysine/ornithine hydrolase
MVEIYSPSGNESEVASLVKDTMDELGYATSVDSVDNIIGKMGEGQPKILLCGHLDTVSPSLPTYTEDGVLHGRGSVDAKSPLAAMIFAGKLAHEKGYQGTILVVGAVHEEGDNRGVKSLINSNMKADYAVFGEPTDTYAISIGYKGCVVVQVTVTNPSGHSSAPWAYPNAIEKSVEFYNYLKNSAKDLGDAPTGFNALTVSVREIKGGENIGVLPRECKLILEFRLPPKMNLKQVEDWFEEKRKKYMAENKDEHIGYKIIDEIDPFLTDKKSNLVKAFSQTIYKKRGTRVPLLKKTGTSDMNYYGKAFGVPIITYGPGDSHLSHTEREKILLSDYLSSIEILTDSILRVEALHNKI